MARLDMLLMYSGPFSWPAFMRGCFLKFIILFISSWFVTVYVDCKDSLFSLFFSNLLVNCWYRFGIYLIDFRVISKLCWIFVNLVQWNLDLRKISICKFYMRHFFSCSRFLDLIHKSSWNQTLSDLRKTNWSFLNQDLPVLRFQ